MRILLFVFLLFTVGASELFLVETYDDDTDEDNTKAKTNTTANKRKDNGNNLKDYLYRYIE